MRVLIFHNPEAGRGLHTPEALIQELQRAGHDVVWQHSADPLPEDVCDRFDLVVAAGGDGSVGKAGRQLVGRGLPIATLPLGTANNLGAVLAASPDDLLQRIAHWRALPFDVGDAAGLEGGRYFLEGFGLGAFADTADELTDEGSLAAPFDTVDELGRDLRRLARTARTCDAMPLDLEVDGQPVVGRYLMAEVLNIGGIGPRLLMAPDADPRDGWLDVALVPDTGRDDLVAFLDACVPGEICRSPFPTRRAQRVRLTVPAGATLHLDGQTFTLDSPGRVDLSVHQGALTILTGTPFEGARPGIDPDPPITPLPSPLPPTSLPPRPRSPLR
jgi:diacylglycerol kinase (ATP)